jgi:hypothetical protein
VQPLRLLLEVISLLPTGQSFVIEDKYLVVSVACLVD